jgi:hypothetical protein
MLIKFFRTSQPAALFAIPLLTGILWIEVFFRTSSVPVNYAMPLYQLVWNLFNNAPRVVIYLLGVLLVSFQALYLNHIITKHEVLYKKSLLPAFMYVILMSLFPQFLSIHPMLFANTLLLVVIDRGFGLYKTNSPLPLVFDLGLFISITSLFYFPSIITFLGFGISLLFLRPFAWREWITGLIGFLLPYFYASLYFFWNDQLQDFWFGKFFTNFAGSNGLSFSMNTPVVLTALILVVFFLLSIYTLQSHFYKNVIKTRIYQQAMFIFLIIGSMSLLLAREIPLYHFTIVAIPMATFIAYYFIAVKKIWLVETLFILLAGVLMYNHLSMSI